jgi:hypothetical protein
MAMMAVTMAIMSPKIAATICPPLMIGRQTATPEHGQVEDGDDDENADDGDRDEATVSGRAAGGHGRLPLSRPWFCGDWLSSIPG